MNNNIPLPPPPSRPVRLPALPEKLLLLSIHHLARLLVLLRGPQPSLSISSEATLDLFLLHLDLIDQAPQSRPGWRVVQLSAEGSSLVNYLLDLALLDNPAENSSSPQPPAPSSPPTPTPPPPSAKPPRRATLSLVHSRD